MKSALATAIVLLSCLQSSNCFVVVPSHRVSQLERAPALSLFGNVNNKKKDVKQVKQQVEKSKAQKEESQKKAWQQFARILVTGSPDGISLLGKPQHDWVTGNSLPQPKAHSWTSSYKKTDKDSNNSKTKK